MDKVKIFLGGSCNPTTWRADVIPMLEFHDWTYYNPQVDDWFPELVEREAEAKRNAEIQLFVIDSQTRAIASIVEATEAACTRAQGVWLVVMDIPDGTEIDGQVVTGRELKDLNRARAYLRDVAARCGTLIWDSVEDLIDHIDWAA